MGRDRTLDSRLYGRLRARLSRAWRANQWSTRLRQRVAQGSAKEPLKDAAGDAGTDGRLALASAVHDGPLQLLMVALQELDDPAAAGQARGRQLVVDAVGGLRDVLHAQERTMPGPELEGQLEAWCEHLALHHPATFRVVVSAGRPVGRLVCDAARELLTNAARHSGATVIRAYVEQDALHGATVCVIDNGCGMPDYRRDGYGLGTLRRRVGLAGGTLQHHPLQVGGTMADVRLPAD